MAAEKTDVLLIGPPKAVIVNGLAGPFNLIKVSDAKDPEKLFAETAPRVRAIAVSGTEQRVNGAFMTRFPKLEIVSSFGVGYDHVDAGWAGKHGITVTNTPDVLTEEVADTALGLLLCTVREFPQAERYVRAGKWAQKGYPLSKATLRNRTVGMVGLGRIGQAIARRLEAMQVPVVYHSRRPADGVSYRHYPKLINMARGSVVDEAALIKALHDKTILSAGLDVYAGEPEVPAELIAMDHVVLFPHLGSASVATREKMDQLVVDNLLAWAAGKPPLTPVAETPWPPKKRP
jgi:lactate dehydrogenase-like 2-hydroxyacid dehydrogenase